jgi:LemA protein
MTSSVGLMRRTDRAFADVNVFLKQRHDLIPNLVEIARGYASLESESLEAVIAALGVAEMAAG